MGVQDLWSIVEPVRESVPLYSLSGKTLAVDLSLWVCEAQHVQAMMGRVTKPHLRNLFFRVSSLTLMGVKLVFVMEGNAPKLKAETMNQRTKARYGGFKKAAPSRPATKTSRGRFNAVLRECADMLDSLGVPWVTAAGEAEAMCAYLDSRGQVDGCITNDGDAFLYGARTVYRNFNMNSKDPQVDCYQTSRVQTELHLSRENLVGLAILLGCDYIPKGIVGVGREQALRLIRSLNGQSLLQRFVQWREEDVSTTDGVIKKVPHCNICRHPGSAKAHERGGCFLCDSKHFCEPRDFDYQCPCDWHRSEQTRQAQSFEANIRRKTMASPHFPFTEIVTEFLDSKDKPVSHFERRQPNMLLMQKFAYDKMEWPRHYTSEKVLVLMTYTELMNRKYGRDMLAQMEPLRILKPRVRNGVACFEVIWRTPEHFVYPDDQPSEDQDEVRTVEEESLFRVAYPDVVDSYLRGKARAEESKTKKKKPKSKKEKPPESSDDLSRLLAEMTLQSSSVVKSTLPHTELPPSSTKTHDVVVLDASVQHTPHGNTIENHASHDGHAETPVCPAASPTASAVIDALHLSDIDWDSASFTSSPPQQAVSNNNMEPKRNENGGSQGERIKRDKTDCKAPARTQQADARCATEPSYTECPLRERVLMRNASKGVYSNIPCGLPSPKLNSKLRLNTHSRDGRVLNNELMNNKANPLSDTGTIQYQITPAVSVHQERPCDAKKPPHKYKFVRTADVSSKKGVGLQQSTKKTVCTSVCSSSDDSDTENRPTGPLRRTKTKAAPKIGFISDLTHKPLREPRTAVPHSLHLHTHVSNVDDEKIRSVSNGNRHRDVQLSDNSIPQAPSSPITLSESDDSVICSESPLPLAERLKLRFLK